MGFLGDMLLKGVGALCGEETGEVFTGDGIEEKKELFEKILRKWDEIFQREDFFNNSTFSKLEETAKLPVFLQISGCEPKHDIGDFNKAKQNSEKRLTRLKLGDETIDFVCVYKLYFLTASGIIEKSMRPFYYFRYTKGSNSLTFRYATYMKWNDQLNGYNYKKTDMDVLTLSFQVGKDIAETFIRWQPEVTVDYCGGSTPALFFNKINHKNVYLNLIEFLRKLGVPTYEVAVKQNEEAEVRAREAEQRRKEARYRQQEEKKNRKRYYEIKSTWEKKADELVSKLKVESALDDFLGSDSSDGDGLFKEKCAKLAEEYFQKGEKAHGEERKELFGIAAELGNVSAKREIGESLCAGTFFLASSGIVKLEPEGLNILNQLAQQGDLETIEWLRKWGFPCPDSDIYHNNVVEPEDNPIKVVDSEKQEQILEQQKIAKEYITYQIKTLCFIFGWHTNASDEDIGRIAYFGNILYKGNDLEAEKLAKEEIERIWQCQTEEDCFKWLFDFAPTDIIAISGSLYATCFCALAKEYSDKLQKNQQVENEEHFIQSCKNFCALRKILSIDEFDEQKMSMSPSCQKAYSEFALAIRGGEAEIATEEDFLKIIKNIGEEK